MLHNFIKKNFVLITLYVLFFSQTFGNFGSIYRSGINLYLYDIFALISCILLLLIIIKNKIFEVNLPFLILQTLFGFLILVSLFSYSLLGYEESMKAILYLIRFGVYFFLLYFVYLIIKSSLVSFVSFKNLLTANFIFLVFLCFVQWVFFQDLGVFEKFGYDPHFNRLVGPFMDPNFLGFFLVLYLIINAPFIKSYFILYFGSILILLTQSRSALITFFGFIIFWIIYKRNIHYFLVLLIMLFGIFGSQIISRIEHTSRANDSVNLRFESYQNGLNLAYFSDYLGIGMNNYKVYQKSFLMTFNDTNSSNFNDSSWISVMVFGGVIAVFLLFLFFVSLTTSISGFVVFAIIFINSNIINSLFYPPLMFYILLTMYLYYLKKS